MFIFAHAGGFSDCGRLAPTSGSATFCTDMAQRGFVVYSIEYRSGRLLDPMPKVPPPNTVFYNFVFQNSAAYRAGQDIRGAIRYIIYRELHEGTGNINDQYRIDLGNVFFGGASAGSVAMLSAAYYFEMSGQSKLNDAYPAQGSTIANVLGNINIDFYFGNDNLNYMQNVKGICNLWGSVNVPTTYFSGTTPNPEDFFRDLPYKPPVIGFCGRQDKVFSYNFQPVYYSFYDNFMTTHNFYNRTSYCLVNTSYTLEGLDKSIDMYNIGAAGFYNMVLQKLGIFSEIYLDCQMAHGLDANDKACGKCTSNPDPFQKPDSQNPGNCKLCNYQSNFGVPTANNTDLTYNYIASRVATFFQTIMSSTTANVTKTSFIECENYRNKCQTDSYSTTNCLTGCSGN